MLAWLARATYPSRDGTHANSAFGLVRALPLARARTHHGDPSLAGAIVSDPTDGQIAHLHGLNLYRAYAYQQLTRTLPDADPRGPVLRDAARRHAEASLPAVRGGDYMAEHWLACYAVLLLT